MLSFIDRLLNRITMYRLTLYYLIFLVAVAMLFGGIGWVSFNPLTILENTLAAVIACYAANWIFAKIWRAKTNSESALITGLIIALLVPAFPYFLTTVIAMSVAAMGAKYFLTVEKAHVFNPAAAGLIFVGLLSPDHAATWWIGSPAMVIPVLLGGLLVARKIRHGDLVWWFVLSYSGIITLAYLFGGQSANLLHALWFSFTNSAILFFAFVMLTEPLTLPGTKKLQNFYAVLIAFFYATPELRFMPFSTTPELALAIGNALAFLVSPRQRHELSLVNKFQLTPDTWLFRFEKPINFRFTAGQYLEWTLPHTPVDSRGNRRYFTIASAPSQKYLDLLVKFYEPPSSYKATLLKMKPGGKISVGAAIGDFTLKRREEKAKLAFIAGGVGLAPFRAFAQQDLAQPSQKQDVVLLNSNYSRRDITFPDLLAKAEAVGWRTVNTLTDSANIPGDWSGEKGLVDAAMIQREIPDYRERTFYVSGPQLMVQSMEKVLRNIGLPRRQIKTDYFPGYAD